MATYSDTLFYASIEKKDLEAIKRWRQESPELLNEPCGIGYPALHTAARTASHAIFDYLVTEGASFDSLTDCKDTPLHQAFWSGDLSIIEKIIKLAPHLLYLKNDNGESPAFNAIKQGHVHLLEKLSEFGFDFHETNHGQDNLLHAAFYCAPHHSHQDSTSCCQIIQYLMDQGVDIHAQDETGYTPLHSITIAGSLEAVKLFIAHGANVNEPDKHGDTPLHITVSHNRMDLTQYLVEQGANIEAKNHQGKTAAEHALSRWHSWRNSPAFQNQTEPRVTVNYILSIKAQRERDELLAAVESSNQHSKENSSDEHRSQQADLKLKKTRAL